MSSLVKTADLRGWWHRTQKGRCGLKSVKFTPFLNKPQTKNAVFRCVDIGAKHAVMNVGMLLNVCQDSVFFFFYFKKFYLVQHQKMISISVFLIRSLFVMHRFCRKTRVGGERPRTYSTLKTAKAFIPCLKPRIAFISNPCYRTFPVDQVYETLQRQSISVLVSFFFAISLYACECVV